MGQASNLRNRIISAMRQVAPHCLWLGNALDARDLRQIYDLEIAAVIDLAIEDAPAQLGREIIYCRFPLLDGEGNPQWLLQIAIHSVSRLLRRSVPLLVACSAGMSRTPAVAAAALSLTTGVPPDDCLLHVVADQPHDVSPLLWREVKLAVENGLRSNM